MKSKEQIREKLSTLYTKKYDGYKTEIDKSLDILIDEKIKETLEWVLT